MRFIKIFLSVVILSTLVISCSQKTEKQQVCETTRHTAGLDSTMTISEIAKANQIG